MQKDQTSPSPRRKFLGTLATGAATLGLASLAGPLQALPVSERAQTDPDNPDAWFDSIKGKHRIVFDVVYPKQGHEAILPFAWPKVFLLTNAATGTPEKENSVVVVLRHSAIGYALNSEMWKKYKLGEFFGIKDREGKAAAESNMFWKPSPSFEVPGVGPVPIGINELQESGVMFCVCDMAMVVNSFLVAQGMKMDPKEVKADWVKNVLPGVKVMPSGLWAVGRAQEHKCSYVAV